MESPKKAPKLIFVVVIATIAQGRGTATQAMM